MVHNKDYRKDRRAKQRKNKNYKNTSEPIDQDVGRNLHNNRSMCKAEHDDVEMENLSVSIADVHMIDKADASIESYQQKHGSIQNFIQSHADADNSDRQESDVEMENLSVSIADVHMIDKADASIESYQQKHGSIQNFIQSHADADNCDRQENVHTNYMRGSDILSQDTCNIDNSNIDTRHRKDDVHMDMEIADVDMVDKEDAGTESYQQQHGSIQVQTGRNDMLSKDTDNKQINIETRHRQEDACRELEKLSPSIPVSMENKKGTDISSEITYIGNSDIPSQDTGNTHMEIGKFSNSIAGCHPSGSRTNENDGHPRTFESTSQSSAVMSHSQDDEHTNDSEKEIGVGMTIEGHPQMEEFSPSIDADIITFENNGGSEENNNLNSSENNLHEMAVGLGIECLIAGSQQNQDKTSQDKRGGCKDSDDFYDIIRAALRTNRCKRENVAKHDAIVHDTHPRVVLTRLEDMQGKTWLIWPLKIYV